MSDIKDNRPRQVTKKLFDDTVLWHKIINIYLDIFIQALFQRTALILRIANFLKNA